MCLWTLRFRARTDHILLPDVLMCRDDIWLVGPDSCSPQAGFMYFCSGRAGQTCSAGRFCHRHLTWCTIGLSWVGVSGWYKISGWSICSPRRIPARWYMCNGRIPITAITGITMNECEAGQLMLCFSVIAVADIGACIRQRDAMPCACSREATKNDLNIASYSNRPLSQQEATRSDRLSRQPRWDREAWWQTHLQWRLEISRLPHEALNVERRVKTIGFHAV